MTKSVYLSKISNLNWDFYFMTDPDLNDSSCFITILYMSICKSVDCWVHTLHRLAVFTSASLLDPGSFSHSGRINSHQERNAFPYNKCHHSAWQWADRLIQQHHKEKTFSELKLCFLLEMMGSVQISLQQLRLLVFKLPNKIFNLSITLIVKIIFKILARSLS